MPIKLPEAGFVFWPVGNGDSTTIVINKETVIQVDINQLEESDDSENHTWSVIDELISCLPRKNSRPYLGAFALTHLDQDHCRGFKRLLSEVHIGELWFTPYIFSEYENKLCDDAKAFKKEARRRIDATKNNADPDNGNRFLILSRSKLHKQSEFNGFPDIRTNCELWKLMEKFVMNCGLMFLLHSEQRMRANVMISA